jgi:hypothetical protein
MQEIPGRGLAIVGVLRVGVAAKVCTCVGGNQPSLLQGGGGLLPAVFSSIMFFVKMDHPPHWRIKPGS